MEKKILKAILEDEMVDWVSVKKWDKHEFDVEMADYLLRAYSNHRESVEESEKDSKESKEEKADKKPAKKSK